MSLAATYLQDIRAQYPSNLDRDELRVTRNGLLTAVLAMTNAPNSVVSADLKTKASASQGRNLDVPVLKKGDVTIKNQRSCDVQCGQSESDLVRIVWKTAVVDICMVPSQYEKNEIGYVTDLGKKINERVEAFKSAIEVDIDTQLDTAKNQVYNSSLVADKYTPVGNALQVTGADLRKLFFNDVDPINFEDDFYSEDVYVVGSPSLMSDVRYYINQGAGNNENLGWQFNGKNFTFSNRITNDTAATGYFMPNGSVGLLTRVDVDARMRAKASDGTEWFEDTLPGLPFTVGIKYDSKCSDQSALETAGLEHLKATKVEHWQISFDYAIVLPYVGDVARPTAIRKFEFLP